VCVCVCVCSRWGIETLCCHSLQSVHLLPITGMEGWIEDATSCIINVMAKLFKTCVMFTLHLG